jgi:serine/threonine-protein kinase
MLCPHCGATNTAEYSFCTNCGSSLSGSVPVSASGDATWSFTPDNWSASLLGRTLENRYRLEAIIGAGGMGAVFRATRLQIGDEAAVKVLHPLLLQDAQAAQRFHREAQTAARLKHPNAVAIYDFAAAEGLYFLVMELCEGRSLKQLIHEQQGPLPPALAANVAAQVCAALDEAHRQGIVHRDIKPDNIMARETAAGWQAKVMDFGIAKLRDQAGNLTQTGNVMGTPRYMSPEQCLGEELDGRSDIYSFGVVLYEMLTGRAPFDAPSLAAVIGQQIHKPPPPVREQNPSLPPAVETVMQRALAKRPEERPPTAGQLAQELAAALNAPDAATYVSGSHAPVAPVPLPVPAVSPAALASTVILPAHQSGGGPARPTSPPARASKRTPALVAGLATLVLLAALAGVLWWRRGAAQPDDKSARPAPPPGMAHVPGGEFKMGSDRADDQAAPVHTVTVKPFYMDVYEVTCADYKKFLAAAGHRPPPGWNGTDFPAGKGRFPVVGVTWDDAKAYAQWAGKRLPTEEEWEFAARGRDNRRYPWGDFWRDGMANVNSVNKGLVAVGSYSKGASPFGVQDLIGNAWEWTDTDLKAYPGGYLPPQPEQKDPKIIRGGSWEGERDTINATFRSWWGARAEKEYNSVGFRCVKDAPANDDEK